MKFMLLVIFSTLTPFSHVQENSYENVSPELLEFGQQTEDLLNVLTELEKSTSSFEDLLDPLANLNSLAQLEGIQRLDPEKILTLQELLMLSEKAVIAYDQNNYKLAAATFQDLLNSAQHKELEFYKTLIPDTPVGWKQTESDIFPEASIVTSARNARALFKTYRSTSSDDELELNIAIYDNQEDLEWAKALAESMDAQLQKPIQNKFLEEIDYKGFKVKKIKGDTMYIMYPTGEDLLTYYFNPTPLSSVTIGGHQLEFDEARKFLDQIDYSQFPVE